MPLEFDHVFAFPRTTDEYEIRHFQEHTHTHIHTQLRKFTTDRPRLRELKEMLFKGKKKYSGGLFEVRCHGEQSDKYKYKQYKE